MIRCALALMMLSWATVLLAAQLPPEIADCKVYKIWQFDKTAEGWKPDHNVGPFTLKDGILSFRNTGFDPWIINTSIGGADASKYRFVGVKMRSNVDGANTIYFATSASPNTDEKKVVLYPVRRGDDFRFYEVDMSRIPTWDGRITTLRLDPVNGADEAKAKVDIDWIALYQVPARLTIGRPCAVSSSEVVVPVTNIGGEPSGTMTIQAGDQSWQVEPIKPHESRNVKLLSHKGSVRDKPITGKLGDKTVFEAQLSVPTFTTHGNSSEIGNDTTQLVLYSNYASLLAGTREKRMMMGVLYPMATLVYRDSDSLMHYLEVRPGTPEIDGSRALLQTSLKVPGGTARIQWIFEMPKGDSEGRVECKLTTDAPIDILRFEGPRLLAGQNCFGATKSHAIFPGLEYLERDEPSSAVKHIGPKLADRHVPHPYKIAVPLMAIETKDGVVGISWEPLSEWAPGRALPSAEFESPNRTPSAKNHLMTLFAPSIPDYVDENTEYARRPYTLEPGQTITLSSRFFARAGKKITDVIPDYYAEHGLPKAPPVAHGVDGAIDTCLKAYTQSLYDPEKNGWKNHIGLHQTPAPNAGFCAVILAEALRKGEPGLAARCHIDPAGQLARYMGTTMDWFQEGARKGVESIVAGQAADGGFPYTIDDQTRKKVAELKEMSGTDQEALGDAGTTNSGLICRSLNAVLEYALKTRDAEFIDAGIKGLRALNSFDVPRGAQTWEVHAHTPDIYAAGLAVDANLYGYHLTGDDAYLDHARRWALTGLPFVYGWVPPIAPEPRGVFHYDQKGESDRPVTSDPADFYQDTRRAVNPGATIPVFGTSFYVINWFGTPVQWCGMAWADAVKRYLRLRPDPVLEWAADAVFASCTQQQFDKGFAAGTYPDSWNLVDNQVNMVFIAPDLIIDYAYALKEEKRPFAVEYAGLDIAGRKATFSTFARIDAFTAGPRQMDASLKFYAGQDLYSCLARVPKPSEVTADGAALRETQDLRAASSGWFYDPKAEALHIKFRPAGRVGKVSARW